MRVDGTGGAMPPQHTDSSTNVLLRLTYLMLLAMDNYANRLDRAGGITQRLEEGEAQQKAMSQLLALIKGEVKPDMLPDLGTNWNLAKGMLAKAEKKSPDQRTPVEKELVELLGPSKDGQQNFQAIQAFIDKAADYDSQIDKLPPGPAKDALKKKLTEELLKTDLPAMRKKLAPGAGATATSLSQTADAVTARLRIEATVAIGQIKQIEKLMNKMLKAFQKLLSKMAKAGAD